MTAQELAVLIASAVLSPVYSPALSKLRDYLDNFAWYQLCTCSASATPAFPAPPALPTGVSTSPTGLAGGCASATATSFWAPGSGQFGIAEKFNLEKWTHVTLASGTLSGQVVLKIPPGKPSLRWLSVLDAGPITDNVEVGLAMTDSSGTILGFNSFFQSAGTTSEHCYTWDGSGGCNTFPSTAFYVQPFIGSTSGAGAHVVTTTLEEFGNCQGGALSPCCTTSDPTTLAALVALKQQVDLIQRQLAPFASIDGPSHSSLTGEGEFSVQGILALSVSLTTVPQFIGVELGDPDTLFEVGWVRFGTSEGWTDRQRITSNPAILTPPYASLWTKVGYTLSPTVVANMVEIVREA